MSNKKAKTKEIIEEAFVAVAPEAEVVEVVEVIVPEAPAPEAPVVEVVEVIEPEAPAVEAPAVEAPEPEAPVAEAPEPEAPATDFRMVSNSLGELTVDSRVYRVTREGRTFLCGSTSARTVEDLAAKLKAKQ